MDNNMDRKMNRAPVEETPEDRPEVQTAQPDEASRKEADSGRLDAMTETLDAQLSPEAEAAGDAEAAETPVSEVEARRAELARTEQAVREAQEEIESGRKKVTRAGREIAEARKTLADQKKQVKEAEPSWM